MWALQSFEIFIQNLQRSFPRRCDVIQILCTITHWYSLNRSTTNLFHPASCKEENVPPSSSLPVFEASLVNSDSGLSQGGCRSIFVVQPVDDPNGFMTKGQLVTSSSQMFPDSHPQTNTPFAPKLDERGRQRPLLAWINEPGGLRWAWPPFVVWFLWCNNNWEQITTLTHYESQMYRDEPILRTKYFKVSMKQQKKYLTFSLNAAFSEQFWITTRSQCPHALIIM